MKRIQPIDGLRAFAVLGVIWAHAWMFFGNLTFLVAGVNINQILSFGGIGVDLFFVISGFCMYLMHSKNARDFSLSVYGNFIKKRWLRIAPAFYFVVLFESFYLLITSGVFPTKSFIFHLLFINTFNDQNVLSPPFWSLATEWHFYIILPLLFISDPTGKYLNKRVSILIFLCMILRFWFYHRYDLSKGITIPADKIWFRFVEFGFGILAARFYIDKRSLPWLLRGNKGFILSFLVAFGGRLCMTTAFFVHFGNMAFVVRAMGEPILTFGFAIMILNLINTESIFKKFVSAPLFLFIGKISYSMYLWHWLIVVPVCYFLIAHLGRSNFYQELGFLITTIFCSVVAMISYRYLEAPYFRNRPKPIEPSAGLTLQKV